MTKNPANKKIGKILNQEIPIMFVFGMMLFVLGLLIITSDSFCNIISLLLSVLLSKSPGSQGLDIIRLLGTELIITGLLVIIFRHLIFKLITNKASIAESKYLLFLIGAFLLIILWLPIIICGRNIVIDGTTYWWLHDDAMISMRYARNFAEGYGLVWNPGEIVEGYTNFLWTLYMSLIHFIGIPFSKTSLVVIVTNIILTICTIPLIIKLNNILKGNTLTSIASIVCFILSGDNLIWATNGMETSLLAFIVLFIICRVFDESKTGEPSLLTFFFMALIPLIRSDGIIIYALLFTFSIVLISNRKLTVIYSLIFLLLPLAHIVFRIYYYGDILPNTAYLKVFSWDQRITSGITYTLNFIKSYFLPITLVVSSFIYAFKKEFLGIFLIIAGYTVYITYIGGDAFEHFRFFIPVLPLLLVLAFISIDKLFKKQSTKIMVSIICIVSIPLLVPGYLLHYIYHVDYNKLSKENLKIAIFLKNNYPSNAKVADFFAGSVIYFSGLRGVDFLGKSDAYIARLKASPHSKLPGHTKRDFNYSLGVLKPDLVVTDFSLPLSSFKQSPYRIEQVITEGHIFYNPIFQKHCLPNPVNTDGWRAVVMCDWSRYFKKKADQE